MKRDYREFILSVGGGRDSNTGVRGTVAGPEQHHQGQVLVLVAVQALVDCCVGWCMCVLIGLIL